MVREITDMSEFKNLINGDKVTVVKFFATWCGPCKRFAPLFDGIVENYPFNFISVDVDVLQDAAMEAEIQSMPTVVAYKNGSIVGTSVGSDLAKTKEMLNGLQ